MSDASTGDPVNRLGFNTGYIEELYAQYLEDPTSVGEVWQEFFAGFSPSDSFVHRPRPQEDKATDGGAEATSRPAPRLRASPHAT